ncbi:MAG: hypothetical protein IPG74_03055 [Flavobacteriales bacterium]|nr:hypothetical protein [Flavobacteriales bacterium]
MKRPFDWGVQPFFDPAVPEHSTAEGAYILSDSLRIAFAAQAAVHHRLFRAPPSDTLR